MGEFSVVYAACATRTRAGFMVLRQLCFANLENCARLLLESVATLICVTNLRLAFRSEAIYSSLREIKLIAEHDACRNAVLTYKI